MIANVDDGRFSLGMGVHPAADDLDGVCPDVRVGIVDHHCDRAREHGCRVGSTSVVLASITSEGMAGLETNARFGVIEHADEYHQAAFVDKVIHRLRRPTANVGVR